MSRILLLLSFAAVCSALKGARPRGGLTTKRTALSPLEPALFSRRRLSVVPCAAKGDDEEKLWGSSLALLLVAQSILYVGVGAVIPTITLYGKAIGLSGAASGIVISAPAVALVAVAPFAGSFADVRGRKPAMLLGMATIVVADVSTAVASTFAGLLIARLGLGLGRCVSEVGERAMLADLAARTPEARGKAVAAQQALAALGIAIGAPIGGIVVEQYGPRAAFLCVSAAATITFALYTLLPETKQQETKVKEDNVNWLELLKEPEWRALCFVECATRVGYAAKIATIPLLAAEFLGGPAQAGALVSLGALAGLVGAPLGGASVDAFGARRVAVAAGLVAGLALLTVPWALSGGNPALYFRLAIVVWSAAVSAQGPALTSLQQQMATKGAQMATALALPRASGDAAFIFAPFVLGLVADATPSLRGAETALAGAAALIGIVPLLALKPMSVKKQARLRLDLD